MIILITGSDGFIGRHLVKAYSESDATIYGWTMDGVGKIGGEVIPADLTNPVDVEKNLERISPDLLIHCAGCADVIYSVKEPLLDLKSNYITTHNLLFSMRKLEMQKCRFILFSSAAVYGNPISLPMGEDAAINPLSPYALHKKSAEEVCVFMKKNYDLDTKVMRIFSVYGPGLRKQLFWDMYQKISTTGKLELFGSGEESRDYIYIDDLVQATMLIARTDIDADVFNIANGVEVTIREAAEVFVKAMGKDTDIIQFMGVRREGEPINWRADISRLKSLGFVRNVSFEDGIERYVSWAKESCN